MEEIIFKDIVPFFLALRIFHYYFYQQKITIFLRKLINQPMPFSKNKSLYVNIFQLRNYIKSNNNLHIKMMKILILISIAYLAISVPLQAPVIGIYTQSDTSDEPKGEGLKLASNYSYIAASYVKYIQISGAQVVPIFAYTKDKAYFDNLLPKLNGVLFPGGGSAIDITNTWTKNADYILKYAIEQNKKGNPFPVWGTCLGWQLLAYLTSGYDSKVLSPVRGESGVVNRLSLKTPSYLFDDLSSSLKNYLQNGNGLVYFNHVWAVSTSYHQTHQIFKTFWNIVSTTTSSFNEPFISGAESKDYPIYGIQFHPQKNLFEWKVYADRSDSGAQIVQILSNKFVEVARTSKNRFASPEQFYKVSIYNYKTQKSNQSFSQIYLFNEVNSKPSGQQSKFVHLSAQ